MSVLVKPGVLFDVVAPSGFLILQALKAASRKLGADLTISSGTDGLHSGPADPHHFGRAVDIRSHDFTDALKPTVLRAIITELQSSTTDAPFETAGGLATKFFWGFLEKARTQDEHFHCQLRQGVLFNVTDLLAWTRVA